ncbi:hypothetical protein NQZ68_015121 [Dissostichus eleginoides]|nr:hypothetical protein NQZ68_015121 [Dissostichus eleginoides]
MVNMEERLRDTEDRTARLERSVAFLLHQEAKLAAKKQVRDVIKKLKEKNVKANSPYPAQLKVFLASGTKTFTTLMEAAPMLRDMGIRVEEDERDGLQSLRAQSSWTTVMGQKEKRQEPHATGIDLQFLTE